MKRTLLVSFLAVAALGLLVAFAFNSRAVPVEAHIAQHAISLELGRVRQDFATLIELLTRAAETSGEPEDTAIAIRERLAASAAAVGAEIGAIPGSSAAMARIRNLHEGYQQTLQSTDALLAELIEAQTAYGESVRFLRDVGPDIIERMREIALAGAATDAFQLIVGTLDFATRTDTVNPGGELRRLYTVLNRDRRLDANMPSETGNLLRSAATIIDTKAGIRSRLNQLRETPVPTAAGGLAVAVDDVYGSAVAAADSARTMLSIYAIVLFLAVGFVGFRLQSSYTEINRANAELAGLNESLEHRVQQRTEELSSALANLKESQVQLVQAEKLSSLGQLVAGISHEINTPLLYLANNAALISERLQLLSDFVSKCSVAFALDRSAFADREDYQSRFVALLRDLKKLLRDEELEAVTEEARDLMRDSIEGLGDLTEMAQSLKDFSRLDRAPVGSFDVNGGIDKTLTIARNVIKDKAEVHKFYSELPEIECSPSKINQVFLNLLTNAAQAIEDRGEIVIKTTLHDAGHVAIAISDTGCGISEENLGKIRDPFFTTKEVGSGTGLGLSIVDDIIRSHGGELRVQSKAGSGSTFTVILPLRQSEVRPAGDVPADQSALWPDSLGEETPDDLAEAV